MFLLYNLTFLLLIRMGTGSFNSFYLKDIGVFADPQGFTAHPYATKSIVVNIGFDNPFMSSGDMARKCIAQQTITQDELRTAMDITDSLMKDIKDLLDPAYNKYSAAFCRGVEHLCDRDMDGIPDHVDPSLGTFGNLILDKDKVHTHTNKIPPKYSIYDTPGIPNSTSPLQAKNRQKRAGPLLILAGIGMAVYTLGNSIYSWISTKQLSDRTAVLEQKMGEVQLSIKEMYGVVHDFRKIDEDMYSALRSIIPELCDNQKRQDCSVFRNRIDLFVSYAYRTRENIIRVLNAALQGQVTTEMMTAHELQSVLLRERDFEDSVYKEDLDLFYRLSMSLPVSYDPINHILSVIIAIPMIANGDMSPAYHITNTGWVRENRMYKLDIPDTIAIITEDREGDSSRSEITVKQVVPVNIESCDRRGTVLLCPDRNQEISGNTACINAIMKHQELEINSTCEVLGIIKKEKNLKIMKALSGGVFVRGYGHYTSQIILRTGSLNLA